MLCVRVWAGKDRRWMGDGFGIRNGHLPLSFGTARAVGQDPPKQGLSRSHCQFGKTSVPAYVQVCGQWDSAAASDLAWVWVIMTGRSRLACAWATQQGGRAIHSDDQSSVKRSSDPLPWFSGKRLGRGFWAAQLSRISWDTILASEKGTAREQSFNVRLGLYEHKTSQQLGRGPESAPCHHGNVRSLLQIKKKTLWTVEFQPFNVNCVTYLVKNGLTLICKLDKGWQGL